MIMKSFLFGTIKFSITCEDIAPTINEEQARFKLDHKYKTTIRFGVYWFFGYYYIGTMIHSLTKPLLCEGLDVDSKQVYI